MQDQRIRNLREDRELTQTAMGQLLLKLADFHDVSVDYLPGRADNPKTNRRTP